MKQLEFTRRKKEEQWELLWQQGEFITERIKVNQTFLLYSIGKIYIEVTFDLESGNAINLEAFTDWKKLTPYLEPIMLIYL